MLPKGERINKVYKYGEFIYIICFILIVCNGGLSSSKRGRLMNLILMMFYKPHYGTNWLDESSL